MKTQNHDTDELGARLAERFGTERPFTVPDGYFDSLPGRVMGRIAQRRRRRNAWRWAAAAVLAGAVAAGGALFEARQDKQLAETDDVQYIEDALDYSMIDNMSIASFLTEAD